MVRAVAALCGATDAFVAVTEEMGRGAGRAMVGEGESDSGRRASPRTPGLVRIAASGKGLDASESIRLGEGLWGRVWQSGMPAADEDGETARIGAPLVVEGAVVGIVGVLAPSGTAWQPDRARDVSVVADLGAVALGRLCRHPR
jgi:hypothetical protein